MSGKHHVDRDVEVALELRNQVVEAAIDNAKKENVHEAFVQSYTRMKTNRVYVWEPPAIEAFWRFWAKGANYSKFMDEFFDRDGLLYKEDMVGSDFHVFPAPGRLFGDDTLPDEHRDVAASLIFPPTTRAIGTTSCRIAGNHLLPSVIETVHVDAHKLMPSESGVTRLKPMTKLPAYGTPEAGQLLLTVENRYPKVIGGVIADRKPITWLICIYQLQIFLLQPFMGHVRRPLKNPTKHMHDPQPVPEIVQVLMREPLTTRVPIYIVPAVHPVTGRKLEFEVDVRGHLRHCHSGKVVPVKPHKRGPRGREREKVIKVIR